MKPSIYCGILQISTNCNMLLLLLVICYLSYVRGHIPCATRATSYGTVCVCNRTYCDTFPELLDISTGQYQIITTSSSSLGFTSRTGICSEPSSNTAVVIKVYEGEKYQTILGFGGAFTDSTGYNILSLPNATQKKLMESYFGRQGIGYSFCRVPVGGTDFSLNAYTYCDSEDPKLDTFKLQTADLTYKIPLIQKAQQLREGLKLNLLASAWSAPPWMKTNHDYMGGGWLKREYYQLWADYFVKFFEAYNKHNITFWGMTTQNEPTIGMVPSEIVKINSMIWLPTWINEWVVSNLGPTLKNSRYKDIKIILHDDNRLLLPIVNMFALNNDTVLQFVDGVAVHDYNDFYTPPSLLNYGKSEKKDLLLLASEACEGFLHITGLGLSVELGSWQRGQRYANYILDDLKYGVSTWVDWNMALDESGGPSYVNNSVDAAIIVNETAGEFYKQPMFYIQGHFSKLILPDSVRVGTFVDSPSGVNRLMAQAFVRPDNKVALIIHNSESFDIEVQVEASRCTTRLNIQALSINTILYSLDML